MRELTDTERKMLDFELSHPIANGLKEQHIREEFALSQARYYQQLNALIDEPSALAAEPLLVHRLARARELRVSARAARRLGRESTSGR